MSRTIVQETQEFVKTMACVFPISRLVDGAVNVFSTQLIRTASLKEKYVSKKKQQTILYFVLIIDIYRLISDI